MDFNKYMEESSRTTASLDNKLMDNLHYTMGMVTEAVELIDVFKKHVAYGREIDWVNIVEELGDFCWYLANFCRINNLDFGEILDINIAKLKARYPERFDEEHANNRNLDIERKILEG